MIRRLIVLLAASVVGLGTQVAQGQTVHSTTLKWTTPAGATAIGYRVYRCLGVCSNPASGFALLQDSINQATTTWVDLKVTAGSTYSYYVTAYDTAGVNSESAPSNVYTGTIPSSGGSGTGQTPPVTGLTGATQ